MSRNNLHDNALEMSAVQQSIAAVTLATELGYDDLSLIMSPCRSPMNHIQTETVTRTLWRLDRDHVVVCDAVVATPDASVAYPRTEMQTPTGASKRALYRYIYLRVIERALWIQSGQQPLSLAQ
ncbi:hypothetical protein ACUN7Z_09035 [Vreelandella venusta]|uniref:hypothetical protein n=1 Tax=Vreelandella venusta TaxID=44935 RepID=UPI004043C864